MLSVSSPSYFKYDSRREASKGGPFRNENVFWFNEPKRELEAFYAVNPSIWARRRDEETDEENAPEEYTTPHRRYVFFNRDHST